MDKLFDKFGKFILLFFSLQIHFVIKGSSAIPGNSHPNVIKQSPPTSLSTNSIQGQNDEGLELNEQQQQIITQDDSQSINLQDTINSNQVDKQDDNESIEIRQQEQDNQILQVQNVVSLLNEFNSVILNENLTFDEESFINSPDSSDRLNYSMLQSTFPLRPKTITRQSVSSSGGGDGFDSEWIEINSEFSGSSRIAKMIFSMTLVNDQELQPITYDQLCKFLDELGNKEMCDQELLIICKRIIKGSECLIKALKDLPLYIKTKDFNQNASKINSILFSYLSNSDKCFLDLINNEQNGNGSGSSRCSSRGSDSSMSSKNSLSPVQSPRIISFSDLKSESENCNEHEIEEDDDDDDDLLNEEEGTNLRVIDEINDAQSHVLHEPLQKIFNNPGNLVFFPRTTLSRMTMKPSFNLHNYKNLRPILSTVKEETITSTTSRKSNENGTEIEEID